MDFCSSSYAQLSKSNLTLENLRACKEIRYEHNQQIISIACVYDYEQGILADYVKLKYSVGYNACISAFGVESCQKDFLAWQSCQFEKKNVNEFCTNKQEEIRDYDRLAFVMKSKNYKDCTFLAINGLVLNWP